MPKCSAVPWGDAAARAVRCSGWRSPRRHLRECSGESPGERGNAADDDGGACMSDGGDRNGSSATRVLVVDDHSVTRHGVVLLCKNAEGVEVIGEASDGNEAIARVSELLPDVVLMDV